MAMLHALLPMAFVAFPSSCRPHHLSEAFSSIVGELADVRHAISPFHTTISMHAILEESSRVDRTISPHKLTVPIGTTTLEMARVLRALRPGHRPEAISHAFHIRANENRSICPILLTVSLSFVISPLRLVLGTIRKCQSSLTVTHSVLELTFVRRAIPIAYNASTFGWYHFRRLVNRTISHDATSSGFEQVDDKVTDRIALRFCSKKK
mmetsp:Transcript_92964/g.146949  ORF Transcript_92964/g.146949 Transcript_92964/m.146949 type:complete len:209 (+) Transcript_92964:212-838(+)